MTDLLDFSHVSQRAKSSISHYLTYGQRRGQKRRVWSNSPCRVGSLSGIYTKEKLNERLKGNNMSDSNEHKIKKNNVLKDFVYYLYPSLKDFQKIFLIIWGYYLGLIIISQNNIGSIFSIVRFLKLGIVLLIIEFLIYQARYLFNDIRGLKADIETNKAFKKPGKHLVQCSNKGKYIYLSAVVIIFRIVAAFVLIDKIGSGMKMPLYICSLSIIIVTVLYEVSRSMNLDIPIILLVSIGYPLRILSGIWCAVPDLFDGNYYFMSCGVSFVSIVLYLIAFAALGGFSVTISWVYEAFYQKKKGEIIKHHYKYLFNSFANRYDSFIRKSKRGYFPLNEKGKISDWWNIYFIIATIALSLNILAFSDGRICLVVLECLYITLMFLLCQSSYRRILVVVLTSLMIWISKIIIITVGSVSENRIVYIVLCLHQLFFLLLYYWLRCKFDPSFDFFNFMFGLFVGKDTLEVIQKEQLVLDKALITSETIKKVKSENNNNLEY